MADIFGECSNSLSALLCLLYLSLSLSPTLTVCAHKFCGCELPVGVCLPVCVCLCVCLPVYLCICYLNILFCQRKSFLQPAALASSRNGEENGEKRRRRRSCVEAKLGGVQAAFQACTLCPAHLPHAKSIYIFHCSLTGPCTCVCVCFPKLGLIGFC